MQTTPANRQRQQYFYFRRQKRSVRQPLQQSPKPSMWSHRQKLAMLYSLPVMAVFAPLGLWAASKAGDSLQMTGWGDASVVFMGIAFVAFCVCGFSFFAPFTDFFLHNASKALEPIPDPFTIAEHLRQELGREPTLQEVESVHNMCATEKREAQINAAIGAGFFWSLHHLAQSGNHAPQPNTMQQMHDMLHGPNPPQ